MKKRFIDFYMTVAEETAKLSYAERRKVGSVIVKDDLVLPGYNGTASGLDNTCETKVYYDRTNSEHHLGDFPLSDDIGCYKLVTKDTVLHAEMNGISKAAKSTISLNGATLFSTLEPCLHCAKAIYQSGITTVYYRDEYRLHDGINFLNEVGVNVFKVD